MGAKQEARERLPELQALEWIPVVPAPERETFQQAARRDGLEGFAFREIAPGGRILPAGKRDTYLPVFYKLSVLSESEARHFVERLALDLKHKLPASDPETKSTEGDPALAGLPYNLAEAEERLIARALLVADGNISKAARLLGVNRTRIYRRRKRKES